MQKVRSIIKNVSGGIALAILVSSFIVSPCKATSKSDYSLLPPFVSAGAPPLVMLVMGRNHKLYYEAYNDASDLNGDGVLDVGYKPDINYYGYFDSFKYYEYDSTNSRFNPKGTTADKKCPSSGDYWSGDFLNYLTMSRMDCLRKVLYGGYRSTDTLSETVLQRVYIPQDAHSWGKEYESIARDGYDIRDYTPFDQPVGGTRHLFASTTLSDNGDPKLRVALNNPHRIWEWVAKERPVCDDSIVSAGGNYDSWPADHDEYENLVLTYANASHLRGSQSVVNINGSGNPFGPDDYYLDIFTGKINISTGGIYEFAVDGDDAVEVIIDGTVVTGWYDGHPKCYCHEHKNSISLDAGSHEIEFRHQEKEGSDNYYLWWKGPDSTGEHWEIVPASAFTDLTQTFYNVQSSGSSITDYVVRVKVCDPAMPESNCKKYPDGDLKPIGLLQRDGESERMYFGLLTGSYAKNTSGGVLRKEIGPITDEIDSNTGQFTVTNGIINTINKFRIVGYAYNDAGGTSYNCDCGWITTHPLKEGQCRMWGNPIAEMMYEGLRYFAGTKKPTSDFTYSGTTDDSTLELPLVTSWDDPYTSNEHCSKPFMLVISDINPTYDSDQLPGVNSNFGSGISSTDLTGMNVSTLANSISTSENISGDYYIGQSGDNYDGAPTAKNVTGFGSIRGLAPEEPTKQGSYYSAGVAYYGRKTDISAAKGEQKVITYAVGLASPLPRITIPVGGQTVTLVPFGKSVGGYSINGTEGQFQPTDTIVDFFVDTITPTYGKFRINYEDVEQGADHDMDAIVEYEYTVNSDNTITITLTSTYASGSIIQHLGYVISGTTADGAYLEVRDYDTGSGSDPDYFLDTPPGQGPGEAWDDGGALPITTSRTFTPGTSAAATLLKNPLWYAAKWGGFEEGEDGNNIPDKQEEWDKDMDGVPDTYFYVTNPLRLEEQLNKSFADILRRAASGTAASVISNTRSGKGAIYQSLFYPEYKGPLGNTVNWVGDVHALFVDAYGNMREDTNGNKQLDLAKDTDGNGVIDVGSCSNPGEEGDLIIKFDGSSVYKYADSNGNGKLDDTEDDTPVCVGTIGDINYLWSANRWLGEITDDKITYDITSQRSTYISEKKRRYIFSFVDDNRNMIPDSGECVDFIDTETKIFPYLYLYPTVFGGTGSLPAYVPTDATNKATFIQLQSKRIINYIRGQDQAEDTSLSTDNPIPAFRNRKVDYDEDGAIETWRLGDIIYSTPTVVGKPAEDFDLLYKDTSYKRFYNLYQNRRNVIYVGANDGMLHAFNGGFFNSSENKFYKGCIGGTFNNTGPDLGAELWAYVPYNLLPHLYWLTESDYNSDYHVAYVDLKPRIFDAKIFADDTDHPDGWGTILVCGMRFGGGKLQAGTDKNNTNKYDDSGTSKDEPVMRSAFIMMDITNPEKKPELLGEISFDGLGFTTCYPSVICMKDKDSTSNQNDWYLVLGSGPTSLQEASSQKKAHIYIVDLKELATNHNISIIEDYELDGNSFVSDPVSVDYDLDYKTDAVYFGTVSGSPDSGWGGKLRRIVIDNHTDSKNWTGDSTLIDADQPITAASSVGMDIDSNRWVFFGTGRFFNRASDVSGAHANDQQTFYGIKEPLDSDKKPTWGEVFKEDLLNVSTVKVYEGGYVEDTDTSNDPSGMGALSENHTFDNDLLPKVAGKNGWFLNFPITGSIKGERNLGQADLLGDILLFTTYKPDIDACSFDGTSKVYGVYYKTGTAYYKSVLGYGQDTYTDNDGNEHKEIVKTKDLGQGLVVTPNIHTGREKGSKAFIQSSTGAIIGLDVKNPGVTKSGTVSWKED